MSEPNVPKRILDVPFEDVVFTRTPTLESLISSGLMQDIRVNGILNDPLTRISEDGRREILAGNGRATCWRELGHKTIRVACLGKKTKAEGLKIIFKDHDLTRTMPLEERLKYLVELKIASDCTLEEAAKELGISPSYLSRIANTLSFIDPKVMQLVYDGKLSFSHAYAMIPVRNPEKQMELAMRSIESRLTREEMTATVSGIVGKKKERKPKAGKVSQTFDKSKTGLEKLAAWFKAGADSVAAALKLDAPDSVRVEMVVAKLGRG